MPRTWALLSLLLLGAGPAAGQTARPAACTAPEHHQFDFWIGEWDVTLPNGKTAGTNRIEPILNGCALRESWTGAGGVSGTSYNAYDRRRRRWHQTWVDGQGNLLQLDGAFNGGKMTLTGETVDSSGATWTTAFDGRYRKRR